MVFLYFIDVSIGITKWGTRPDTAIHVIKESDISNLPQVHDGIEMEGKRVCFGFAPCPNTSVSMKVYEAYALVDALQLRKGQFGHYSGVVEYRTNYYSLYFDTPQLTNYLSYSLVSSVVGIIAISLAWVRFGQTEKAVAVHNWQAITLIVGFFIGMFLLLIVMFPFVP